MVYDSISADPAILAPPSLLMDKLDSLKKGLLYFPPVDSINKIEPKVARAMLKDSIYRELKKKPKHIYLTFDDGPLLGSLAIDSIVTAKGVKSSVFLIGKHAKMSKMLSRSLQKYLENPLVEAYNHSYTHANHRYQTFYSDPTAAYTDFVRAQEELGLKHKVARLPGRNIWMFGDVKRLDGRNGGTTAEMLHEDGFQVFGWDVEWRINGRTGESEQSVDMTYKAMKSYLDKNISLYPNNVVLLMHDDMFQLPKAQHKLAALIDSLKQHPDYSFEFMTDYPKKY
ncbi:polysaccharide deacetylase family protein [Sphingobacterium corticibacter]|uniref:polysaccharide deacetylase family protein n=1 Tax=Sphingobacterium corticibacter TaxID=2171749 RepID=UPI0013FD138D|nr:polysaccharide deacetylase family protein [Sphingobacterium corticibacter]